MKKGYKNFRTACIFIFAIPVLCHIMSYFFEISTFLSWEHPSPPLVVLVTAYCVITTAILLLIEVGLFFALRFLLFSTDRSTRKVVWHSLLLGIVAAVTLAVLAYPKEVNLMLSKWAADIAEILIFVD